MNADGMRKGRIEVICGCMFSGKTELLMDRVTLARAGGCRVAVFKHAADDRYASCSLVAHSGRRMEARPVSTSEGLVRLAEDADVIAVDEAQFFDDGLPAVCRRLRDAGRVVILAGLDRDSWDQPFGPMPALASIADDVCYRTARCRVCGEAAEHTQRTAPISGSMVGGPEAYEPRCGRCFVAPPAELRR